jgi:hypothetical protein
LDNIESRRTRDWSQLVIMRSVTLTIIGIFALGWGLATLAPPHWLFGELFLLAASVVVIRDYLLAEDQGRRMRGTSNSMLAGNSAWCTDSTLDDIDGHSHAFHPWDFDRAVAKTRNALAGRALPATNLVYSQKQSVEQIAHDILMQAFRQASRTHHVDSGGDPEAMRRVYAARDLILRAIHKP